MRNSYSHISSCNPHYITNILEATPECSPILSEFISATKANDGSIKLSTNVQPGVTTRDRTVQIKLDRPIQ